MNNRMIDILKIIFCVVIIFSVLLYKNFAKKSSVNLLSPIMPLDVVDVDPSKPLEFDIFSFVQEDVSDNDEDVISYLYFEELFEKGVPKEAVTFVKSEIESHLFKRYATGISEITFVAVLKDSIKVENDFAVFSARINKASVADYIIVSLDMKKLECSFEDISF